MFGLCLASATALAADYRAGPDDYRQILPRLQAGDRLLLEAGDYTRGLPLHRLEGKPGAPIVVEGPAHGPRARFIARAGANTLSLLDVCHLVIRNLELDGRNLSVDAVKAEGHARLAHYVTLENLHIHDHAASQQNVGISSKCPAVGWIIRGNRIERVGTGLYLGNSDGRAPFVGGLIEGNQISDTLGYNLQIKHQLSRPEGLPETAVRQDTVIRHNFFSKADSPPGSLTPIPSPARGRGELQASLRDVRRNARPNVLVGHFPLAGPGSEDRYLIHGNLFWHNPAESLFQGEGNVALYNNVFVTQGPDAVRIQPHNAVPREVRILQNTVLATHNGITVRVREDNAHLQAVAGNAVFAARAIEGGVQQANQIGAYDRASLFLSHPYAPLPQADLTPRPGRLDGGEYNPEWRRDLPAVDQDFLGRNRPAGVMGAYGQAGPGPLQFWLDQWGFMGEDLPLQGP
jgi:hypothetical protein